MWPIKPKRVRYIKLGEGGMWEQECRENGIIRFGFGSSNPDRFPLCDKGDWAGLKRSFMAAGRRSKGTATRFTNETQLFFEDDGSTLWITFMGERLFWGFLSADRAEPHVDGDGVLRHLRDGWKSIDRNNSELTKVRLSGALTQLAAYRGTSCSVRARRGGIDVADYIVRRINGDRRENVEHALMALTHLKATILELIKELGPRDFEILVDLIFSVSGWRRQGTVGGTQATLDLDLMLPSTGEKAFVQVKSHSTQSELAAYVAKLDELGPYDRMFYVYHTGDVDTDDERVSVIHPEQVAKLAVDAGLADWIINRVS